jgi:hypothetical protein
MALRPFALAALFCLAARLIAFFEAFWAYLVAFLLAFVAAFPRSMFCFGLASMLVVKPKLNASASASARSLISFMLLRNAGKPQIHL